jgi:hypothetical protein
MQKLSKKSKLKSFRKKAKKYKVHNALFYAKCPVCSRVHNSASEFSLLPTYVFCNCVL